MAVLQVQRSRDVVGTVKYLNGKPHRPDVVARNYRKAANFPIADDTLAWLNYARKARLMNSNVKYEVVSIVQSFSREELDPNEPVNVDIANRLGVELAENYLKTQGGKRPYEVFTQLDGNGGNLHNHILIGNVATDTGRAIDHGISFFKMRDLNDVIIMHSGIDTSIQEKLIAKRDKEERSMLDSVDGRWHKSKKYEANKKFMRAAINEAASNSTSRQEFEDFLLRLNIRIHTRNLERLEWEDDDGNYAKQIVVDYGNTHSRLMTLMGYPTLENVDQQLNRNAQLNSADKVTKEKFNQRRKQRLLQLQSTTKQQQNIEQTKTQQQPKAVQYVDVYREAENKNKYAAKLAAIGDIKGLKRYQKYNEGPEL